MTLTTQQGRIPVPGGDVWFVKAEGDAATTPLIGLHGGPGFTHDYLESLLELAPRRTVVLYDQLGSGRSDKPEDPSLWTLERFVEELEAVRTWFGFQRIHLLGHSWGGALAASYVRRFPGRVSGLHLASPLIKTSQWLEHCQTLLGALDDPWPTVVKLREADCDFEVPDYQAATFAFYQEHFCRIVPWPNALVRSFRGMNSEVYETMWGPTEFSCTGVLHDFDGEDLGDFDGPILLSCGRFDEASESYLDYLSSSWPNAQFHLFSNSSHSASLEETAAFLYVTRDFLDEVDAK